MILTNYQYECLEFQVFLFGYSKIKTAFQDYGHRQRKNRHVQRKNTANPWELTEQKGFEILVLEAYLQTRDFCKTTDPKKLNFQLQKLFLLCRGEESLGVGLGWLSSHLGPLDTCHDSVSLRRTERFLLMVFIKLIWNLLVKRAIVTRCWWCVHGRISVIQSQRDPRTEPEPVLLPKPCFMNTPRLSLTAVGHCGVSGAAQRCSHSLGHPGAIPFLGLVWRPIPCYFHSASLCWGVGQEWGQTGRSPFLPAPHPPSITAHTGPFLCYWQLCITSATLTWKVNGFFPRYFCCTVKQTRISHLPREGMKEVGFEYFPAVNENL